MIQGLVFKIQRFSVHDGPGIRTTVFLSGCPLRCLWCHNPESFLTSPTENDKYDVKNFNRIYYTPDSLLVEIEKDRPFYEESGGGVTFSGGEPLMQIDFLEEILKLCKKNYIHTAVDTCGDVPYESFERIIPYTDIFLYDLKHIKSGIHKKLTGRPNELILENLKKLAKDAKVYLRLPLIDKVNTEYIGETIDFIKDLKIEKVSLLPYHDTGSHKYEKLGMDYKGAKFKAPDIKKMNEILQAFQKAGFDTKIGG